MTAEDVIIWIDLMQAKLFHARVSGVEKKQMEASQADQHAHRLERDEGTPPSMYDRVAHELKVARRIVIVGPGVAKYHLLSRLRENFPLVAKKVVVCDALDHVSDGDILAYGRSILSPNVTP